MRICCLPAFLALLTLLPPAVLAGDEMAWEKKTPFESATIHYLITGMEEGTETLFVRDHGRERATYRNTTSNMMGMKMTNRTVEFKTPDSIYKYDLEKGQGFKSINPQKIMIEEYERLPADEQAKVRKNAKQMGGTFTEGMGGEIKENAEKLFGYDCDRVKIMGGSSTYLIHNTDIALKTEMKMMGMELLMVADSVDKGKVDDKAFDHPAGIKAEESAESDRIAKNLARQAIAMLKDPEKAKDMPMMPQLSVPGDKTEMSPEDKEMMEQVQRMLKGVKTKPAQ